MKSKNEIINELDYKRVKKIVNSYVKGAEYEEDVLHDIILILLEMDDSKFFEMYNKRINNIYYYISGIARLQMWSKQHNKKYKTHLIDIDTYGGDIEDLEYDYENDDKQHKKEDKIIETLNEQYWFDKELFKLYIKNDENIFKVQRLTKISRKRITDVINKVKNNLKK